MKHNPSSPTDPLMCWDYSVSVNGNPIIVHGAKSCKAPFPFKVFRAGEHPGIKLARKDAQWGPAQIAEAGNAPYAFARSVDGNTLTLSLAGPAKVSIEPDGRHGGLLLFHLGQGRRARHPGSSLRERPHGRRVAGQVLSSTEYQRRLHEEHYIRGESMSRINIARAAYLFDTPR